jgi:fermentation-respiration switch protein FrsA (DUF1100 family)
VNPLASYAVVAFAWLTPTSLAQAPEKKATVPASKGLDGMWEGTLKTGLVDLRLLFKISRKPDGKLTGTLNSLDQGARDLPIDVIELKDRQVRLELTKLKAAFRGTMTEDASTITGHWHQSVKLPLTLRRTDKAPTLARPQTPKKPYPYAEHDVTVENKAGGVKLAGTLTMPRGDGPFPAVVLLTGSGPQDRDETIFAHKPFLVIADFLTRRGVAVLRLDDRGVGGSTGDTSEATLNDLAGDALAAVAFLKCRKEINAAKIGLVGHSEGGLVAPLAASLSGDVAFIVLLAGTGLPGEEILYLQGQAILKSLGAGEKELKFQRATQELMFRALKEETDKGKARELILKRLADEKAKLSPEAQKEFESARNIVEGQIKMILTPWFRFFLTYDPRPTLRKVKVPVLVLIGEKDLQVPPTENLKSIREVLKEAGHKDHVVKEMPGLNHLFQNCKTGRIDEYSRIEETFAPAALEEIAAWIRKTTQ